MARKTDYDDIEELMVDLQSDLVDAMQGNVDKKIKQIYKSKAEQSYRDYSPKYPNASRYRRGESDSFADENNFKEEVVMDGNTLTYTLENHRETDCDCAYCRSKRIRIDQYIEQGIASNKRILAKKVYEKAQLQIDNEIPNIIISELNKKGW